MTEGTNPPWIYGEEGVLLPFEPEPGEEFLLDDAEMVDVFKDKRLLWKIKWGLLKTALKFFFTRW